MNPFPLLVSGRLKCQRQPQEQTKLIRRRMVRTPGQRAVESEDRPTTYDQKITPTQS